jgi:uncharacterized protein (TIGR02145 family)
MKTYINNFKHLCTLLLTALAFVACSSDNDDIATPEPVQPANGDITFTAVFGVKNATTRALSDPGNGTLTASWQRGEQIAIVFGGNKYTATVTEVDNDGNAIVSATLPSGTPNNQAVTFIYPASAADGSGLLSDLLATQDGTLATLSSTLDVATADGNIVIDGTNAQPNGTVTLVNQFAICKFQFTDEDDHAIEDITSLTITDLATTEVINVTTPSAAAVYVAMMPSNNSMKFKLVCSSGKLYLKTASAHLEAGLFYHPTFQVIAPWVDLGLPTGTLWAKCNVGANSPEELGDHFAWGETTRKSNYLWTTYKYSNSSNKTLKKYCYDSSFGYNGFTDTLKELEAEDDAATVNWGSEWQMPSSTQIQELINNTNTMKEWTTLNGVNGYKITSRNNGKSIFLPAAGSGYDTSILNTGSFGYYWSSSISTYTPDLAFNLSFKSGSINQSSTSRDYGNSVRPVLK